MDCVNLFVGLFGTLLISFDLPLVSAVYSCVSYRPYYSREFCYTSQTCCGYGYRYCCDALSSASVAGIAIGCIIGIVCLGAFIVICCKIMNKNRGQSGRVVYPNNGSGNVTILNSTQNPSGYPGYPQPNYSAYPSAPAYPSPGTGPAYPPAGPSQYPPPPPQYSQADPAPFPQKY